jgi:hypothetical protein
MAFIRRFLPRSPIPGRHLPKKQFPEPRSIFFRKKFQGENLLFARTYFSGMKFAPRTFFRKTCARKTSIRAYFSLVRANEHAGKCSPGRYLPGLFHRTLILRCRVLIFLIQLNDKFVSFMHFAICFADQNFSV